VSASVVQHDLTYQDMNSHALTPCELALRFDGNSAVTRVL